MTDTTKSAVYIDGQHNRVTLEVPDLYDLPKTLTLTRSAPGVDGRGQWSLILLEGEQPEVSPGRQTVRDLEAWLFKRFPSGDADIARHALTALEYLTERLAEADLNIVELATTEVKRADAVIANAWGAAAELDHVQRIHMLVEAIRLTVEYVGLETLPAIPGWSWYDALVAVAPEEASRFREEEVARKLYHATHLRTEVPLKTLREALAGAQSELARNGSDQANAYISRIGSLIQDIDRQRPLAADGKHGTWRDQQGLGPEDRDAFRLPVAEAPPHVIHAGSYEVGGDGTDKRPLCQATDDWAQHHLTQVLERVTCPDCLAMVEANGWATSAATIHLLGVVPNTLCGMDMTEGQVYTTPDSEASTCPGCRDALDMASAWSDYRAEYGTSNNESLRHQEYKLFKAGWQAHRDGDTRGVVR